MALSFLYLIRCSLHGAALKKNVPMLSRVEKVKADAPRPTAYSSRHQRRFSEVIDIENEHSEPSSTPEANATIVVTAQPTHASLKQILYQYGHSQYICSLVGGFGIIPCVATAPTMFMVCPQRARYGCSWKMRSLNCHSLFSLFRSLEPRNLPHKWGRCCFCQFSTLLIIN